MSFLDRFTKEIDKLKDKILDKDDQTKGQSNPVWQHTGGPPQQSYGPLQQTYGPPQQSYAAPPPPSQQSGPPQPPPGWITQWDQNSQRWYYVEQATGRTQWDFPAQQATAWSGGVPPYAGYPTHQGGGGGQYGQPPPYYGDEQLVREEKKDKGSMAGVAVGALGGLAAGGLIGHALGSDSSDEESHHQLTQPSAFATAPPPVIGEGEHSGMTTGYYDPTAPPPPGSAVPLPDETASGSSVSSSDKEDVEEAREEYEEAIRDGDSASDIAEAREEYQEEYEETYDD